MSNTNTMGGDRPRNTHDAYCTPDPLALAICRRVRQEIGRVGYVVEPSAGAGAFVRAVRAVWPESGISAVEPYSEEAPLLAAGADDVTRAMWEATEPDFAALSAKPDLIIGNPPFTLAEDHIRIALRLLAPGNGHLAFLLRASILATAGRVRGLWREHPPRYVWHVAPRPSFTGGGTDGAEYAVVVWLAGHRGPYEGGWLEWTPEPKRRAA